MLLLIIVVIIKIEIIMQQQQIPNTKQSTLLFNRISNQFKQLLLIPMKTHILKSASKVVKSYPENSARFSTMTITILHLQLLTSFFIGYNISEDKFAPLNILIQVFRIFNLETVMEQFPNIGLGIYAALVLITILTVALTIAIRCQSLTRYVWYWMPLISPIVMGMSIRGFLLVNIFDQMPGFDIFLLCSTAFFILLWVIRRLIFIETFGQANMSIQREIYIWTIIISVGNHAIGVFTKRFEIITIFSLVMIFLIIMVMLFRFSYIYPELEYTDFVCKFVCLGVCVAQVISFYFDDSLLYILVLVMIGVFVLQKLSFMKSLLSMKYIFLCKKVSDEQTSDSSLIVLVVLLCRKKVTQFKLGFEQYLQMAYIQILYKIGVNSFNEYSNLKRQYLFQFLENRYDHSKEEHLNIFLAYWFMHYKMFIKAVKYMTYLSQQKDSFFVLLNNAILTQRNKTFLKNCRLLNVKEEQPASHSLCRMDPNAVKQIDPQDMFIRQSKLQQLTKMVSEAFQTQTYLTKRLLLTSINANQVQDTMKKLWLKKNQIIKFFKQNQQQFKHKQFVIIQYLFWTVSCHKKFMIFEDLEKTFLPFVRSESIESSKEDFLAVIVSGENDSIGIIVLANKSMREFFNLSPEKVRSRSQNIDQILPRSISQQHNAFLYSFKQRGTSNFIGKPQDNFIVIKQGEIFRTDAYIKIYQHLDGLMFAGRLKILQSTDRFILYDSQGFIQNYSKEFELKNDKAELLNIYDMIDTSPQQSSNQHAHLNVSERSDTKNKRHASELAKTSLRKRYSDSKLKGSLGLIVNNRRVKANFDYFVGEKYFQGICVANLQTEMDEGSLKQIILLKQDRIKEQSSHKSLTSQTCEKNYFEMERRVWQKSTFANRFIIPFISLIVLLFVSISISVGLSEINMLSRIGELKTLTFLQHYSQGYRASILQTSSICYLTHAVNAGMINNTDAEQLGYPEISKYLNKSFNNVMTNINHNYVNVLAQLPSLPMEFGDVFTSPIIPLNPQYNLSYHEVGNYAEFLFKQIASYQTSQFETNWATIVLIAEYFTNSFMDLVSKEIYPQLNSLFLNFVDTKFNTQKWIIYLFICIEGLISAAIYLVYGSLVNEKRKSIELLSHLSDKQLMQDLAKIQVGLSVTQQLGRFEVENFMVNDKYRTLSFQLVSQQYSFRCQQIKQNTYWEQQAQTARTRKKKIIRFPLRVTKSSTGSFLLLIIIATLVYYYKFFFETINSVSDNIKFYFDYSLDINNVNVAESGLLLCNVQSYVSGNQNASYLGMSFNDSIGHYKNIIFNRTYVDILVKNIPWQSAKSMLFQSYCKDGQSLCKTVLQSSFTRGANTASISFALQNLVLVDKFNFSNISEVKSQLISFMISYIDYFAPFFEQSLKQSRDIVFYLFDESFINLQFVSKFIIVPIILLCLLGMSLNLYVMNKEVKFLNREVFSIYSVDILTKHMQFAYEINKLK